jgi:hypothetical protein
MRHLSFILCLSLISVTSFAGRISGLITDEKGNGLGYASVLVKGTTKGTTANSEGKYFLNLEPGTYTLVCQHVGFAREEKKLVVGNEEVAVNFQLHVQELTLSEVVIKKGEDPAYAIIRQAIKKRPYYNEQVDSFSVDVYIKGLLRSRAIPQKVFGKKIERDDFGRTGLDSSGKGILFLSESLTKVFYVKPNKIKYEVLSSRQSGGGGGGLSFPFFINFYDNNVAVFNNSLNQRGFISPIANGALNYYRYKFEGSFFEDGKEINRIRVIPRRKNEPLFSGYIQITEDDWRIHSLDLMTTTDYSLELIDTLRISQIHVPVAKNIWKTKDQVVYVAVKKLGFDFAGNFVNVYTNYNITPAFRKKFFDRILMKYDSAYTRKDSAYWTDVRPIPLEADEKRDFVFKDSVAKLERDSMLTHRNLDSLRRHQKPMTVKGFLLKGDHHYFYNKKLFTTYSVKPILPGIEYNSVEGLSFSLEQNLVLQPTKGKYSYNLSLNSRYGISNTHFNSYGVLNIHERRTSYKNSYLLIAGGKRLSQFNHDNPIEPLTNSVYTLLYKKNYMKLYENWFGHIEYNGRFENGLRWNLHATYEDRLPVENTTDFSFFKKKRVLLPNHPYELADIPFNRHQAFVAGIHLEFQPGQRYIQMGKSKFPIGSKYPVFELDYSKGIDKIFGSDVDYDKWKFTISDKMNFKIGGEFRYSISIGGFINANKVEIPDLTHFNGNRTYHNFKYLNSFQLAPYYQYSNAAKFYTVVHAEHHFNGLITNKIPLFNKLKWTLVAGTNTFYVNRKNYYAEGFVGLENIFKLFRVDFVTGWQPALGNTYGVRIGFGGLLGRSIQKNGNEVTLSF